MTDHLKTVEDWLPGIEDYPACRAIRALLAEAKAAREEIAHIKAASRTTPDGLAMDAHTEELRVAREETRYAIRVLARFVAQTVAAYDAPKAKAWIDVDAKQAAFVSVEADAYRLLSKAGWLDIVAVDGGRYVAANWRHDPFGNDVTEAEEKR